LKKPETGKVHGVDLIKIYQTKIITKEIEMQTLKLMMTNQEGQMRDVGANLSVLKLMLCLKRGMASVLKMVIRWQDRAQLAAFEGRTVHLVFGETVVFTGQLMGRLMPIETYCLEAVFEGAENKDVNWASIVAGLNIDPLFYTDRQLEQPEKILKDLGITVVGGENLDATIGRQHVEIAGPIAAEGFKLEKLYDPLSVVQGRVAVEWIQEGRGRTDISEKIARLWPDDCLKTLNGVQMQKRWFKVKNVPHTPYEIAESSLELVPALTQTITIGENRQVSLYAFKPHLTLDWHCQFPRREVCTFRMEVPGQAHQQETTYQLEIDLQDITRDRQTPAWVSGKSYQKGACVLYQSQRYQCQSDHESSAYFWHDLSQWQKCLETAAPLGHVAKGQYFNGRRGQQSLAYALQIAQARLKDRWLCQRLSFQLPLAVGQNLMPDMLITVKDRRLPDGELTGVCQQLIWRLDGEGQRYEIECILLCPPKNVAVKSVAGTRDLKTLWPWDLAQGFDFREDPDPMADIEIGPDLLVQGVRVKNPAEDQLRAVGDELAAAPAKQWRQILDKVPTTVEIDLADLIRDEPLERHSQLKLKSHP
tara:strand:+ start:948 stop:2717 length:1770 start_codon:yes stop_codon:yes gene_type:complete